MSRLDMAALRVLLHLGLRRDRVRLAVWVLGVGGFTALAVTSLATTYPTAAERQGRAAVMADPAGVVLSGPGYGLARYTLGAMVANELQLTLAVTVAILSIQLVVRHTRAEEEGGRAELPRAGPVGRRAPLAATAVLLGAVEVATALVVTGGLVSGGLAGSGLAVADALAFGTGIALIGATFGALAAVVAQLTEHARTASGAALAALAAAVVVRGLGDVRRRGGSPLSWASPVAWAQQTRPFVDLRWWPLLPLVALAVVLWALALALAGGRDLGAGVLAPRCGRVHASALLRGPTALTLRLQRGSLVAWALALGLVGAVFGSLTDAVTGMIADNPALAAQLPGGDPTSRFVALTAGYLAQGVAAFAVASVLRLRAQEAAGLLDLVLAAAVDRRRLLAGTMAVTAAACAVLLLVGGLGAGVAAAAVGGDATLVVPAVGASLVTLPAVLVVAALAAAAVALAPRRAGAAWTVVGLVVLVGPLGALLRLPSWAPRLSPFGWLPAVPAEPLTGASLLRLALLTATAAALAGVALVAFRRRDVGG